MNPSWRNTTINTRIAAMLVKGSSRCPKVWNTKMTHARPASINSRRTQTRTVAEIIDKRVTRNIGAE
jgi:hypothetical protein